MGAKKVLIPIFELFVSYLYIALEGGFWIIYNLSHLLDLFCNHSSASSQVTKFINLWLSWIFLPGCKVFLLLLLNAHASRYSDRNLSEVGKDRPLNISSSKICNVWSIQLSHTIMWEQHTYNLYHWRETAGFYHKRAERSNLKCTKLAVSEKLWESLLQKRKQEKL